MGCGVFLGSAAIKLSLDYPVLLPMYFACMCWTLVYDTIYAHQVFIDDANFMFLWVFFHLEITLNCDLVFVVYIAFQDRKDDLKVGVKSTAVTFGDTTKYWLSGFGAACIGNLALTGYNAHLG